MKGFMSCYDSSETGGEKPSAVSQVSHEQSALDYSDTSVSDNVTIIRAIQSNGFEKYIGARYMLEALAKPDSQISYTNMRNLFNHYEAELIDEDQGVQIPLFQFNYSLTPEYESDYTILDERALKEMKKRLVRITAMLAERRSVNDDAWIDDLIEERDFIVDELIKGHTRYGNLRTMNKQNYRDRQAVTKAVRHLVEHLRKLDPELGRICDRHLELKTYLSWRGEAIDS